MANRAFYRTFQTSPLEAEGQPIYSLSRGSWDLPGLRDSLDRLLQGAHSFPDFEVQQNFPGLGHRSLGLGAPPITHLKTILLPPPHTTKHTLTHSPRLQTHYHLNH